MVKKLYKHEFAAWLRVILFFWAAPLLTGTINRIVQIFENDSIIYNILLVSSFILYGISILICLAVPTFFGIVRFYKNFFTGEGYLTFTLPATKKQLLFVKISTAVCFSVISFLVCVLSGLIVMAGEVLVEVSKVMPYLLKDVTANDMLHLNVMVVEYLLWMVIATASGHFFYYLCICIGQLFKKNRILAAVGVYFAFYMITQVLSTVFTVVISILAETGALNQLIENLDNLYQNHTIAMFHATLWVGIVVTAVGVLIQWSVCHWVIHKKLNLE